MIYGRAANLYFCWQQNGYLPLCQYMRMKPGMCIFFSTVHTSHQMVKIHSLHHYFYLHFKCTDCCWNGYRNKKNSWWHTVNAWFLNFELYLKVSYSRSNAFQNATNSYNTFLLFGFYKSEVTIMNISEERLWMATKGNGKANE